MAVRLRRGRVLAVLAAGTVPALLAGPATAATRTETFGCSGGEQSWTVPTDITEVTFVVDGAAGAPNNFGSAGLGGRAEATVTVDPGDTYSIVVGCEGDGSPSGSGGFGFGRGGDGGAADSDGAVVGGGGGGSGVLLGADVLLVGGGAGGSASAGGFSDPAGGAGGGTTGADGISGQGGGGGGGLRPDRAPAAAAGVPASAKTVAAEHLVATAREAAAADTAAAAVQETGTPQGVGAAAPDSRRPALPRRSRPACAPATGR